MQADDMRESLAEYAHEAWSRWMKSMFEKGAFTTTWNIYERRKVQTFHLSHLSHQLVERWQRQMNTPYSDLPESEKESDRAEADRMLAIVQRPAASEVQPDVLDKARALRERIAAYADMTDSVAALHEIRGEVGANEWQPVTNGTYHTDGPEVIDVADEVLRIAASGEIVTVFLQDGHRLCKPVAVQGEWQVVEHFRQGDARSIVAQNKPDSSLSLQTLTEAQQEALRTILAYHVFFGILNEEVALLKPLVQRPAAEAGA